MQIVECRLFILLLGITRSFDCLFLEFIYIRTYMKDSKIKENNIMNQMTETILQKICRRIKLILIG